MRVTHACIAGVLASLGSGRVIEQRADTKPVFAHYMIGEINDAHTRQDIVDAKALGLDAFAMNFDQFKPWSRNTVDHLFKNAEELGFGLFFSFDHAAGKLSDPNDYADYLLNYTGKASYFKYKNKPVVSTFGGESVPDSQWKSFKSKVGNVLVIPGFYQADPSTTFNNRESIDGVFNWNSWLPSTAGKGIVSTKDDKAFQSQAKAASKLFMMGISPIQFKHLDSTNNWYRRGEDNLEYRFGQALDLQPDMLELQTWNDAGEGHYMGNVWDEPMTSSPNIQALVKDRDHKGYWQVLPAFIKAWKNGDKTTANMQPTNGTTIQGVFWHHTLTVDADCGLDPLEKSGDIKTAAEDAVSGIVLVKMGHTNLVAVVNVGSKQLGKQKLVEGYNKFKFTGLTTGKVQLEVWDGSTMVGGGYGKFEVVDKAPLCNYNFQVVGLSD